MSCGGCQSTARILSAPRLSRLQFFVVFSAVVEYFVDGVTYSFELRGCTFFQFTDEKFDFPLVEFVCPFRVPAA